MLARRPGFNPLPLPKQGEISNSVSMLRKPRCFNPLPLPKQGEIFEAGYFNLDVLVSIRSPYRSKGRFRALVPLLDPDSVSIRSPYRSKGRSTSRDRTFADLLCFNPLPLPKQGEIKGEGWGQQCPQ